MVIVEHKGSKYGLITSDKTRFWVDSRNKIISEPEALTLREIAVKNGVPSFKLDPLIPIPIINKGIKRRKRRKKGIAVRIIPLTKGD